MLKKITIQAAAVFSLLLFSAVAWAHCEIPCGIYGDEMRYQLIAEHITTVEKSMKQITELSGQNPVNYNQLVRWVVNKEDHATQIQDIISQYFLHQRIKPTDESYVEKLKLLHAMLIEAMKCKQSVDLSHVEELRKLGAQFHKLYFGDHHK